nr:hypothetical protein Iba_chr10dCG11290 [Ipomoea batatas]
MASWCSDEVGEGGRKDCDVNGQFEALLCFENCKLGGCHEGYVGQRPGLTLALQELGEIEPSFRRSTTNPAPFKEIDF